MSENTTIRPTTKIRSCSPWPTPRPVSEN